MFTPLAGLLLSACAMMSTDVRIDAVTENGTVTTDETDYAASATQNAATCQTYAGSYSLPKTYLQVRVLKTKVDEKDIFQLDHIKTVRREDPRHTYCLEYNAGPTSDDLIQVKKTVSSADDESVHSIEQNERTTLSLRTNLLESVASDGIDRSGFILTKLVNTIFKGIAHSRRTRSLRSVGFKVGEATVALQVEFDPFDPKETARMNHTLRKMGFCMVLGGYSFNTAAADINWYCSHPIKYSQGRYEPRFLGTSFAEAMEEYNETVPAIRKNDRTWWRVPGLNKLNRGILYRPERSYPLYVFGTEKPDAKKPKWKLSIKREVGLENISPIVSVDMERPFFNQRKTLLSFHGGVLKDVCVFKTSELLEISGIPLVVVKSITKLPANILQLKLHDTNNEKSLVALEERLLGEQSRLLQELDTPPAAGTAVAPAPGSTSAPTLPPPPFDEADSPRNAIETAAAIRTRNDGRCKIPDFSAAKGGAG